ncbi:MAG: hypothetical protein PHS30_10725 [Bacteroidales bacterium]|nr:hypothetical protein [Bacteroidales bacterium]
MLLFPLFSEMLHAQGDLMIFPKRVVFEGSIRSVDLNLANIGNDTARYTISFLQYRMTEMGKFEEITTPDPGQFFADPYLRFYPRNIILAPKESQTVKVQLSRTSQLQPGEYRSHAYFRSVPKPPPLGEAGAAQQDSGISIRLTPIFGITIPVIIRIGTSNTQLILSEPAIKRNADGTASLDLILRRTGNWSVYGNIAIDYLSPTGKVLRAGFLQGISVYAPNLLRRIQIPLDKVEGINYRIGKLHVEFSEEVNFRPVKRAELDIILP